MFSFSNPIIELRKLLVLQKSTNLQDKEEINKFVQKNFIGSNFGGKSKNTDYRIMNIMNEWKSMFSYSPGYIKGIDIIIRLIDEVIASPKIDILRMTNYGKWLTSINNNISMEQKNIASLLFMYTGSMNTIYNRFLRGYGNFNKSEIEEYKMDTKIIEEEICQFELNENIIVYRYTHKKLLSLLFKSKKPKIGEVFHDRAFASTTLVKSLCLKHITKMKSN